ncbi:MAG TPA: glycosyltransferase family 4 protein [Gaiellaceae bacterium]
MFAELPVDIGRDQQALRIVVHDFSGFPFPVQLSRELARRGHSVLHLHCPSYLSGKGAVARTAGDPPTFSVEPVELGGVFEKYTPGRRFRQEREYGRRLAHRVHASRPDVIVSCDTPLLAQQVLVSACSRIPFVFWQQDIYSVAMKREAERRLPVLGRLIGNRFLAMEQRMLERSQAVVTIAEDFRSELLDWGLSSERLHVIENWAPLAELPVRGRDNEWARRHGLVEKRVLLYSGTLGLKHNPGLLLRLALAFRDEPDVCVVVVSEGVGAEWLRHEAAAQGAENLIVLGFQPYEELPDVLATGDILVAILEREAGRFAVPSKVLTYLCAARPLLAALPRENLAATVVAGSGAGLLTEPDDADGFVNAARKLLNDPILRTSMGAAARAYAESRFDIEPIVDRFEEVLKLAVSPR